jgi:hypothetical protein
LRLTSVLALLALTAASAAEPIPVLHTQGATRGFIVIRSTSGKNLGYGEYSQLAEAGHVTGRLTLHFRDGSIDDDTTVYTQNSVFRLVSDHHIQRGPFFPHPIDMLVESSGDVTTRSLARDGSEKVEKEHIDLPADLANGLVPALLLNTRPAAIAFEVGMIAPEGKGRLIHLEITREAERRFSCVTGFPCKATVYRVKPELGGIVGVVAPLIGKQPKDVLIWIREGTVPAIVREQGPLGEGTPAVSIELGGTLFPR